MAGPVENLVDSGVVWRGVQMGNGIVLLGFCVGDAYFERFSKGDAFPQIAAYKLESRFRDAMRAGGANVRTVASIAISTYPRNKHIWVPGARLCGSESAQGKVTGLVNLPVLKMVTRFLGSLRGLLSLGKKKTGAICVYAAHSPNLLAAYVAAKFFGVPYFIYIPDLPLFMDMALNRSLLLRWLKQLDSRIISFFIQSSAGVFVITERMIKDNPAWQKVPYMVLEGIAAPVEPGGEGAAELPAALPENIIFYAGGVNRSYGIFELVEGFLAAGIDYELWICGRGDLEQYLAEMAAKHANIKYLGFVSPDEVAEIQSRSAALALTRNPAERYTRYSFPSKLLEYMAAGVPVLTTRLEGIPKEYYEHLNVIEEFSKEGIAAALRGFSKNSRSELAQKSARGKAWVLQQKTAAAAGESIIKFMRMHG